MRVQYQELAGMHDMVREELKSVFNEVLNKEWYIQGDYCKKFESEFAQYCGRKYCVGVGNGLDALKIGMLALGISEGDEVLVPANTFIATVLAITAVGAIPVLVDADLETLNINISKIREKITAKTKALVVVHLYGRIVQMDKIIEIVKEYGLKLIEDAAQAHGAVYNGKSAGGYGDIAAFSFYPGKNLGALGDAGAILMDDEEIYKKSRMLGNYGAQTKYEHELLGMNSRLDEMQAAFLLVKLLYLDRWNKERQKIAKCYIENFHNDKIYMPKVMPPEQNVYHIFPILCKMRDELREYLCQHEISTNIHYPKPIYEQKAYAKTMLDMEFPITSKICREELSLPIYPGMNQEQIEYIIDVINTF